MAIDLKKARRGVQFAPPRVVLYGPHGIGKTTFGAQAPNAIVLMTEDGIGRIDVPRLPETGVFETFDDIMEALNALGAQEHDFQTVVLDTLDWLEPLIWAKVCATNKWTDIEAPGFGKGYIAADEVWREFFNLLNLLREFKGMQIILLAHTEVKQYQDPSSDPYDRYQIKLQKRSAALVQEWADTVLFCNYKTYTSKVDAGFNKKVTRGVGQGERMLYSEERPAWYAKNRYGLPPEFPFSYAAFNHYMYPATAPAPVETQAPAEAPAQVEQEQQAEQA